MDPTPYVNKRLSDWLYPELRNVEPAERQRLLAKARESAFDVIELAGLAIALALTVVLTRYSVAGLTPVGRIATVFANFIVALPLMLVLGGPFYVRRTRRGLREILRNPID